MKNENYFKKCTLSDEGVDSFGITSKNSKSNNTIVMVYIWLAIFIMRLHQYSAFAFHLQVA